MACFIIRAVCPFIFHAIISVVVFINIFFYNCRMMKATAWFCPVLLTLLSATRLVCTAQRGAAATAAGAAGAGSANGYPLDYLDVQAVQVSKSWAILLLPAHLTFVVFHSCRSFFWHFFGLTFPLLFNLQRENMIKRWILWCCPKHFIAGKLTKECYHNFIASALLYRVN